MAGEAILAAILKRLGSFGLEEINLARGVKEELEKLKETVLMIEAVISDAENKQVKEKPVEIWLNKLKDLAYEADDILDEYAYDHHHEGLNHMRDQVHSFFFLFEAIRSFFSKSSNLLSSGHEIKDLNQKFDQLARQRHGLGLQIVVNVGSSSHTMGVDHGSHGINRETYAFVDESKVLGREVDKSNIINMLLANKSSSSSSCKQNDRISVIPIVGMGGLGKTTLARLVYNDTVVKKHFELRFWVYVSNVFDVQKLFIKIIESLPGNKIDVVSNLDVNIQNLQQRLDGKKFLLVLDDVWNKRDDEWNKLKDPLVVGAEGSKILVTTRSEKVVPVGESYKLQTLKDDICLSIFEQRAFGPSCKAIKTPILVEIGKELVRKCGGLPLALEALGSLMHSKKEVRQWKAVRDSKIWDNDPENPNKILPALKLSYDHLLPQVKPCFSYCSMFPKDSEIERETLIRLWVAEGFIQPFEGVERSLEEIGNVYFNNLLWNSFFQCVSTNEDGEITKVKMHDLIHDLAQSVAGTHECSITEASEMGDISEFRRLAIATGYATVVSKGNKLRTLLVLGGIIANNYDSLLNNNKRLRVLDLSGSCIGELPASIGDLKHLRYLDLSGCWNLKKLPDSITRLYNLQTLKLEGCKKLKKFPNDLNKLIKLRHLSHGVRDWELKVGQLTCLQTLSGFGVPEEDNGGSCVGGGIGELQRLNLLGGRLEITGLERVRGIENAKKANLKAKKYIKELSLCWRKNLNLKTSFEVMMKMKMKMKILSNLEGEDEPEDEDVKQLWNNDSLVLEGLQPHPDLRSLEIVGFMGTKFPAWMSNLSSCLRSLVKLGIYGCKRCKQLPALGVLPSLRFLVIHKMPHLEEWQQLDQQPLPPLSIVSSSSSYPSLESITISDCPKLKSMPTKFFSLKEFTVGGTSNGMDVSSIVRSNLNTLTKLDIQKVVGLEFLPLVGLLKGNSVLESLEIWNCPDCNLEGDEDLLLLSNSSLHTLELHNCPNLTLLPGNLWGLTSLLSGFPSMERLSLKTNDNGSVEMWNNSLSIKNTPGLMFLPLGLLKGNNVFEKLSISNCPDFQGFIQQEDEEDLSVLSSSSSVHTMELENCPNLTLLPGNLRGLTSLRNLIVKKCESIELCPILESMLTGFPSMQIFILKNDNGLVEMWKKTSLSIKHAEVMWKLFLIMSLRNHHGVHNGTYLRIKNTRGLMFLPLGLLKGNNVFEHLSISNCPNFQGFIQQEGDEHLSAALSSSSSSSSSSSLRRLELRNCPVLMLPPDLKDFITSLREVTIEGCNEDLVISLPNGVQNQLAINQVEESEESEDDLSI